MLVNMPVNARQTAAARKINTSSKQGSMNQPFLNWKHRHLHNFPVKNLIVCGYKISMDSINLCALSKLTFPFLLTVSPMYKFAIPDLFLRPPCLFASFPVVIPLGAGRL